MKWGAGLCRADVGGCERARALPLCLPVRSAPPSVVSFLLVWNEM